MALISTFPLDQTTYGFEWLRYSFLLGLQEGVVEPGDFRVTAAAAGGMRVDVAAGTALVAADTGVRNGLYVQVNDAVIANAVTFPAADGTNPRVDQVFVQVNDVADLGSAGNTPALAVAAGTATAGATLDNPAGVTALPANSVRLADVLIPAGSTSIAAANVRDRRRWARGAFAHQVLTAEVNFGSHFMDLTIECSGAPVRVVATGLSYINATGVAQKPVYQARIDTSTQISGQVTAAVIPNNSHFGLPNLNSIYVPSPGRHRFSIIGTEAADNTGSNRVGATLANFHVEEILRGVRNQ